MWEQCPNPRFAANRIQPAFKLIRHPSSAGRAIHIWIHMHLLCQNRAVYSFTPLMKFINPYLQHVRPFFERMATNSMRTTTQDGGKLLCQSPSSSWFVPKQKSGWNWSKVIGFFRKEMCWQEDGYRERQISWSNELLENGYPTSAILVPGMFCILPWLHVWLT